jgi:excisionase family DNA binding protein
MVMGDLMTVEEVAAMLRVPKSWVYGHTSGEGERIPFLKIGRHLRFRRSEIQEWLQSRSRNKPEPSFTQLEGREIRQPVQ